MFNKVLLTGNLLLAGALFLRVLCKRREGGARGLVCGAGWLLESAVCCAGFLRLSELILEGVRAGGEYSLGLYAARLMLAESMIFLFLLGFLKFHARKEAGDFSAKAPASAEGEFYIGIGLLLWLTKENWQEEDLWKGFRWQLLYLALFFALEIFRHARLRSREELVKKNHEAYKETAEAVYRGRQAEYLRNVDIQYQRTRELWHDLKNHLGVLEILARESRYVELIDYLGSFRRDVEFRMIPMQSGCAAVDALLSDKCYRAERNGIAVALELCSLSDMELEATDLCVVLGNLLDNALEACARLHQKGRIRFSMKQLENFYYLTVINTSEKPRQEEGRYISRKKGRENGVGHGLGLRSVERIAHQYGGFLATAYEEGEFKAVVRLQNISR